VIVLEEIVRGEEIIRLEILPCRSFEELGGKMSKIGDLFEQRAGVQDWTR